MINEQQEDKRKRELAKYREFLDKQLEIEKE